VIAMSLNLGCILQAGAVATPEAPLLRLGEQVISYAEMDRTARSIAAALRERGIQPGDKVSLLIPNVPEFTMAYFGILYAGAAVVTINVLASAAEVAYFIDDSGSRMLIAHPLFGEVAKGGAEEAGVPLVMAGGEGSETLAELAQSDPIDALHPTRPDDTAVILYTSGTTGKPKGAELTHSNLLLNCAVVVPKLIPNPPGGLVALATLPLFHSFGQTCIQNATIAEGGSFILLPRFTPEEALGLMEEHGVTLFAGVPTMYFAMLHADTERTHDLSKLHFCMTGGAPMPSEVMSAVEKKFGVTVLEGYGLSETSPVSSFTSLDRPRKAGSIGYPVWGVEMQIVDDEDNAQPDGERGEICIRGHNIMKGYLNRPEASKETLKGGWFHSGDIGLRDEDGCYWIVDRKKDMILRGGFNVYPREVEEVLYSYEAVGEAAVIGIPHDSHGEEVKAVIAFAPGKSATQEEIIAFCKERLAAYKYPRVVEILDALPKGPTGKILKRELS
jgi:long-chain acyl-CoA synthetase